MARGRYVNPWIPLLVLISAIATAMSLGRLHELQNADSIVPILLSLQRWTPFFWLQDRFGMFVPLLAMPVRDPLMNLVVQGWLMISAALAAPFVVTRLLVNNARSWFLAGAFANILLLVLLRPEVRFDWLVVQPYALSMTLASAGLIAAEHRARTTQIVAALVMILAHWVNLGVVVFVLPLVLLRRGSMTRALVVTACGLAAGVALMRLSPFRTTTALLAPSDWPHAWLELLVKVLAAFPHPTMLVAVAILAASGAVLTWVRGQPQSTGDLTTRQPSQRQCGARSGSGVVDAVCVRQHLAAAAIALFVAATYWLAAGTFRWVQVNMYLPRYVYPSLLMCGVAAGVAAAGLMRESSAPITVGTALALCVLTVVDYGLPSSARLRAEIDARLGALTPDVIASGATVIAGNYWIVWPAVFHANLTTYRHDRRAVYGLAYRSAPTDGFWKSSASAIIVVAPAGDRTVEGLARRAGLTTTRVGRRAEVDVFLARMTGG
jgi:hypothetical protein